MTELMSHYYTIFLARWFLAVVLLVASINKLFSLEAFTRTVVAYEIFPFRLSILYAKLLPWIEFILGFSLLIGLFVHVLIPLVTLLFLGFMIAISINLIRGRDLTCNCFGSQSREKLGMYVLLRNLFFLFLSLLITWFYDGYFSVEAWLFGWPSQQHTAIGELIPLIFLSTLFSAVFFIARQVLITTSKVKRKYPKIM